MEAVHGTARRRGRDLAQRNEAQGGCGRCAYAVGHTIRHVKWKRLNGLYPNQKFPREFFNFHGEENLQILS